jgi:hypothetical protein
MDIRRGIPSSESIPAVYKQICSTWISGGAYPPRNPYQPYARNLYQAGYTPLEIHTRSIKHCVLQMDIRRGIPSSVSAPETQNATCAKWIPGGVYPLRNLHQRSRLVLLPSSNPCRKLPPNSPDFAIPFLSNKFTQFHTPTCVSDFITFWIRLICHAFRIPF